MNEPTFRELNDAEWKWVEEQKRQLPDLAAQHSPAEAGPDVSLDILDRVWSLWLARGIDDLDSVNAAINVIGINFGQILVDSGLFRWVIATDDYGTDLAIVALEGRANVLVYPADFVSKRWEKRESDFLRASYGPILHQVEQIEQEWRAAGK